MKQPVEQFNKLVDKFSHIGFIPLDVPRFEPDNWADWHNQYHIDSSNVEYHPLDMSPAAIKYRETVHFWGCCPFANIDDAIVDDPSQFFTTRRVHWEGKFPHLWDNIQKILPFKRVDVVTLWNSKREVKGHKDQHWNVSKEHHHLMRWPSEFRIEIYSENPVDVFRVRPKSDDEVGAGFMNTLKINEEMATCVMPPTTNSWAFRNEGMVHGSKYLGCNKHLLLVRGIFDVDKLDDLFSRSISKYEDYLIPSSKDEFSKFMASPHRIEHLP